jgi:prophage tail gpP-like protein
VVGGTVFASFTEVEIARDLAEFCGSFAVTAWAPARSRAFLGGASNLRDLADAAVGQQARLEIDGEVALVGWVEDLDAETAGEDLVFRIAGRDRAGDLVDCAAAPDGPGEYRDLTLTEIVARIAQPFGLSVRAEVDVGPRFARFGIEPDELAYAAISKACRQRAILCVSDGVGGLVLTRSGNARAPDALRMFVADQPPKAPVPSIGPATVLEFLRPVNGSAASLARVRDDAGNTHIIPGAALCSAENITPLRRPR